MLVIGLLVFAAVQRPDPVVFREQVLANPHLHDSGGEGFCWHFAHAAHDFLRAHRAPRLPAHRPLRTR